MMSRAQRGSCLNSTSRTPKHPSISRPSTSLNFPSAPLPISRTLRTQSPRIGLLADVHRDVAPLRGGKCQGLFHIRSYLLSRSRISRAELTLFSRSRDLIPMPTLFLLLGDVRPRNYIVHLMQ